MATLSKDRDTIRRNGQEFEYPVAATTKLYKGQPVCLDTAGNLVAASLTTGLVSVGVLQADADNSAGNAADIKGKVRVGEYRLDNYGSITKTSIGDIVYFQDNTSVKASSAGASPAGLMTDIDSQGVWVLLGQMDIVNGSAALLVANELGDVTTPLTGLNNLMAGAGMTAGARTVDSLTGAAMAIGGTTATTLNLGRTGQLVECLGNADVEGTFGCDGVATFDTHVVVGGVVKADGGVSVSSAGDLAIGAATATSVTITPPTTITGDLTLNGGAGALTMTAASSSILCLNNSATGLSAGSSGMTDLVVLDTRTGVEKVKVKGTTGQTAFHVDVGAALVDEALTVTGLVKADGGVTVSSAGALAIGATTATQVDIGAAATPVTVSAAGALSATAAITGPAKLQSSSDDVTVGTAKVDGGSTVIITGDGKYATLPVIAGANKGMKVTVINGAGGSLTGFKVNANNYVKGTLAAVASGALKGKGFTNTKATPSVLGDYCTVQSDGTDTWFIIGGVGVWASES